MAKKGTAKNNPGHADPTPEQLALAQGQVALHIQTPEGELQEVTPEFLSTLAVNTSRVTEIYVSYDRRLNTEDFEGEQIRQGVKIDFTTFWNCIPAGAELDPAKGQMIQEAFARGARHRIGLTLRSSYVNVLYAMVNRARFLRLKALPLLNEEFAILDTIDSFDPMDVRGLHAAAARIATEQAAS